jgi:hypothetical protein
MAYTDYEWRKLHKGWQYETDAPRDSKWQEDRQKLFKKNGNGWWWGWHLVKPDRRPIDLWPGRKFGIHSEIEPEGD